MKKIGNNKGFTLVELLAVIVVLAIVMGIAAVAITNVLDSTRKNAYIASAKQYIAGAKTLVNTDQVEIMMGGTGTYAPKCPGTGYAGRIIKVKDIPTEGGSADKSSYGNLWLKDDSYVAVIATATGSGSCNYSYYIYLTDGVYKVGAPGGLGTIAADNTFTVQTKTTDGVTTIDVATMNIIPEVDLDSSDITVVSGS